MGILLSFRKDSSVVPRAHRGREIGYERDFKVVVGDWDEYNAELFRLFHPSLLLAGYY